MRRGIFLIAAASLLIGECASAAIRKRALPPKQSAMPQLMQSCAAHKFETVVHAIVDGEPHDSKVKLCGVEGQSDADWIKTLKDAIGKLQANKTMVPAVRDQIVTAINREIARISIAGSRAVPAMTLDSARSPEAPLSRDYSSLPPLPAPLQTAVATPVQAQSSELSQPRKMAATQVPLEKDVAQLPPLPAPPTAPPSVARPSLAPAVGPRLTFGCDSPGDLTSDAPCADFERETMLTIHARDDVPMGTLLQFVRNDRSQAQLSLEGLRRGGALRTALPAQVCRGFTNGKLELRIVRGESGSDVLSTDGPYSLRC